MPFWYCLEFWTWTQIITSTYKKPRCLKFIHWCAQIALLTLLTSFCFCINQSFFRFLGVCNHTKKTVTSSIDRVFTKIELVTFWGMRVYFGHGINQWRVELGVVREKKKEKLIVALISSRGMMNGFLGSRVTRRQTKTKSRIVKSWNAHYRISKDYNMLEIKYNRWGSHVRWSILHQPPLHASYP